MFHFCIEFPLADRISFSSREVAKNLKENGSENISGFQWKTIYGFQKAKTEKLYFQILESLSFSTLCLIYEEGQY